MMCDNLNERIDKWFEERRGDIIAALSGLVAIPSVLGSAEEGMPYGKNSFEALKKAGELLEGFGFETKYYDNCALSADLNGKEPLLAMLAHVDVVPEGDGWETDPFTLIEKDGCFYGRGTSDDKGPAVAAMFAMAAAKELAPELTHGCRLILGSAEETGMNDLSHYEKYDKYPPLVFSPDADFPVINTEKGKFGPDFKCTWMESGVLPRIVYARGGDVSNIVPRQAEALVEGLTAAQAQPTCSAFAEKAGGSIICRDTNCGVMITATGASAHASMPTAGLNANTLLIGALTQLPIAECDGYYRLCELANLIPHGDTAGHALGINCSDELSGEITVNFGIFEYGLTGMSGNLDIRTPVCADSMPIAQLTEAAFGKAGISCNTDHIMPSHHVDENCDFVKTLLGIYEEFTGEKGEALAVGGLTYVHDIPGGVAFGCTMPGHDACIHGANEHITADELFTSAKMFTKAIIEICK